jgi:hypothetical protein
VGEAGRRAVEFIKRNASAGKPFYAYVPSLIVLNAAPRSAEPGSDAYGRRVKFDRVCRPARAGAYGSDQPILDGTWLPPKDRQVK